MGVCFSLMVTRDDVYGVRHPAVNVISINGSLHQYPLPVTVSQVLHLEETASSSSFSSSSSSFICNSDRLYYGNYIPALESEDELEADQIYFILPRSKLENRMGATDMAALAVKASLALQNNSNSNSNSRSWGKVKGIRKGNKKEMIHFRRNYNKSRISPVLISGYANSNVDGDDFNEITIGVGGSAYKSQKHSSGGGLGISRSGSVRKLQRYTSKRAMMAVRSFRLRLSTIHEGSIL